MLVVASAVWTGSWTRADSTALFESFPVPESMCAGTSGGSCHWILDGVFYPTPDHNALIKTLKARRHRYEAAEDEIMLLEARIVVLEAKLDLEAQRLENAEIRAEIAKESCPTWFEQRVGWCAGVGASVDTQGRVDASAGVLYGFKF